MAAPPYRDGAAHERREIVAERERLTAKDRRGEGGSVDLSRELAELRVRVHSPITCSIDAAERRGELNLYDAAIEASALARANNRIRRRVRIVFAGLSSLFVFGGVWSISAEYQHNAELCRTLPRCATEGRCAATLSTFIGKTTPYAKDGCVARTQAHCARACALFGLCEFASGRCVARSDAACVASDACRWLGDCAKVGDGCEPLSGAHCTDSLHCQTKGRCRIFHWPTRGGRGSAFCTR